MDHISICFLGAPCVSAHASHRDALPQGSFKGQCSLAFAGTRLCSDPLILGGPGGRVFVGSYADEHARPVLGPDGPPLTGNALGAEYQGHARGVGEVLNSNFEFRSCRTPQPGSTRPTPPSGGLLRAMPVGVCRHSALPRPPYLRGTRPQSVCRILHLRSCAPCARSQRPAPQGERLRGRAHTAGFTLPVL